MDNKEVSRDRKTAITARRSDHVSTVVRPAALRTAAQGRRPKRKRTRMMDDKMIMGERVSGVADDRETRGGGLENEETRREKKKYLQPTTRDIYDTCLIGASSIVRQHNQEGNESVARLLVKRNVK
jgi:hypothetical protein